MNRIAKGGMVLAVGLFAATVSSGQVSSPGSLVFFPTHHSGGFSKFTILSVTNTDLFEATNIHFVYINTVPNVSDPLFPLDCFELDRIDFLTPADTLNVLTTCHNAVPPSGQSGYVYASAQDPAMFNEDWSFNSLVGSELVVTGTGISYSCSAIPFKAFGTGSTDYDGDSQIDFDGIEYERIPDLLFVDSFMALPESTLSLSNLSGGAQFTANALFRIWNDNEFPLSQSIAFKCWFEQPLEELSFIFDSLFLSTNTIDDPVELDLDCDANGDVETGWFIIDGLSASSTVEMFPNPAFLGAITNGFPAAGIDGGRLLWGSEQLQGNGDTSKFSTNDPEYPCVASLQFTGITTHSSTGGIIEVMGSLKNTGMSPILGIEIEGLVPIAESRNFDLGRVSGPIDLGGGATHQFAFQLVSPGPGSTLQLTAAGDADITCGLSQIVAAISGPISSSNSLSLLKNQ